MKFTGHERGLANLTSAADDLDYMNARFYNPQLGRFLSVDPARGDSSAPQTWNRYSYVRRNPMKYMDPDGANARVGWKAGIVRNHSSVTIWVAADVPNRGVVVIPLDPGEGSQDFFEDADALVVGPGQRIDGETSGAFKVSIGKLTVEGESEAALSIDRSFAYLAAAAIREAGHSDPPDDSQWKVPANREAAERTKKALRREVSLRSLAKHRQSNPTPRSGHKARQPRPFHEKSPDPFAGTGFCGADNVCH